jgi:hypothetical protein
LSAESLALFEVHILTWIAYLGFSVEKRAVHSMAKDCAPGLVQLVIYKASVAQPAKISL